MTPFEKATLVLAFFAAWGVIFFGIWAVDIMSDFQKILADVTWSIVFIIISISYAYWSQLNPKLRETVVRFRTTNFEPLFFGLGVSLGFFEAFFAIFLAITTWTVFEVSGIPVITYGNLVSISFVFMGAYIMVFIFRQVKERSIKRKKKKDKMLASF